MRVSPALWLASASGVAFAANGPPPLSIQMALSIASRSQGIMTGAGGSSEPLQAGFTQKALAALIAQYPKACETRKLRDYFLQSVDAVLPFLSNASKDAVSYPMDRFSNGNAMVNLYEETGELKYLDGAQALRTSIDLNKRTVEEGLWYYVYANWSYLDGMASLAPFYSLYTQEIDPGNETAIADMLLQLDLLWTHCQYQNTSLLVHGYDASKTAVWADPVTGASPHVWDRSLGWFAMSLVDTLEILDSNLHADAWEMVLGYYHQLAPAIATAADSATGGWWQVMDQPGRTGNYIESSGSAMFVYALLKGARLNYLEGTAISADAVAIASKGYEYIADHFVVKSSNGTLDYNGTVSVCSLNSTASYEYYVGQPISYNSVLGSAAFVLASLEYEKL